MRILQLDHMRIYDWKLKSVYTSFKNYASPLRWECWYSSNSTFNWRLIIHNKSMNMTERKIRSFAGPSSSWLKSPDTKNLYRGPRCMRPSLRISKNNEAKETMIRNPLLLRINSFSFISIMMWLWKILKYLIAMTRNSWTKTAMPVK